MGIGRIFARLFKLYKYRIYPGIEDRRGATRLYGYLKKLSQIGLDKVDEESADFFAEDWDHLIILDACRHDLYEKVNGETDYRISPASHSGGFIEENFSERNFDDIVYVTANPHFHESIFEELTGKKAEEVFHSVFHVYETDWNEEEGTVMPEAMVKNVKTAAKLFPDKRIVAHFMQPHNPFIGYDFDERKNFGLMNDDEDGIWQKAERGEVEHEAIMEAYEDNLRKVMPAVEELSDLGGKVVVTSDHGNLIGENELYGHPKYSQSKALRIVPWEKH